MDPLNMAIWLTERVPSLQDIIKNKFAMYKELNHLDSSSHDRLLGNIRQKFTVRCMSKKLKVK